MRADVGKYSKILVASGAMVFGVICVGAVFGTLNGESVYSIDQENYQRLDFTFEPTIQITLSSSTLLVSDLMVNTYSDSNTIDIFAGTNVAAGMQLTATVGSADNLTSDLVQVGTANAFESIATNANLTNLGESESSGIWGYSYKDSNSETWGSYNGLPVYGNPGALLLNTSDAASGTINFKIAAKASSTQVMGNYANSINFSAVAKVVTTNYDINFLNGGNDVTNWPTNISSSDTTGNGAVIALSSLVPAKDGYSFAGWCTVSTNDGSCAGNIYQPGENYPISAVGNTVIVNLYAMWQALPVTTFDDAYAAAGKAKYGSTNYYAMQDMTADICGSVTKGQVGTLIDIRGATEIYTVAKLADGKCWMTENLNIAGGTALSADDTDVTSTYIGGFTNQANLTKSGNTITLPASATKNSGDNNLTDSGQFSNDSNAYVFNSGTKTNCGASGQNTPCYSYYSWIAATLGGKQANGTTAQTSNGYNAAASICPKGWKLPTSTTSNANAQTSPNWKTGDWYALAKAYGANLESNYLDNSSATGKNFYNNAGPVNNSIPNFLLAGNYNNSSFNNGGSNGYYWSSTSRSSTYAYYLYFGSSFVSSAYGSTRRVGFSVRCLAAPSS